MFKFMPNRYGKGFSSLELQTILDRIKVASRDEFCDNVWQILIGDDMRNDR